MTEADELIKKGETYSTQGQYEEGVRVTERALALRERYLGPDHPDAAEALSNLAWLYHDQGKYDAAERLYRRALAIWEKALGPEHPLVADSFNNLALLHHDQGKYGAAKRLYRRALAIQEKVLGPEHPDTAVLLNNLALLHFGQGKYGAAKRLYQRVVAIMEKVLGPEHAHLATALNGLAGMHRAQGKYDAAERLYRRTLAIQEKVLGPEHPDTATSLNNLATLYYDQGKYDAAERLFGRTLAIREKALGPEHPLVALSLNNLATLYHDQGKYDAAERLHRQALAIWEKALGPEHPDTAASLDNLATLHLDQGNYDAAERLHRQALAIREKALRPEHPDTATSLNNLAAVYHQQGKYDAAERLHRRALAIREKALGPEHPLVADSFNDLAQLHRVQGKYDAAERLHRRALAIREEMLGPEHLLVAISLHSLALLHWARGDIARAVVCSERAEQVREAHLNLVIAAQSEHSRRAFLDTLTDDVDRSLTLALETGDPDAQRLASIVLLRRKGRVLDSLASNLSALRSRLEPAVQSLFDEYQSINTEYATRSLHGPGRIPIEEHREHLDELAQRRRALERELAARSQEFRAQRTPVTIEATQDALPPGAALVEWVRYRPFDPKVGIEAEQYGPARYAACLLRAQEVPTCLDLGEASTIDTEVDAWRRAIAMRAADAHQRGRTVEARIMAPIRQHLGNAQQVFLSPDGALHLVPFAALVDEQGQFLVERYTFTYLTSGSEIVRRSTPAAHRNASLVIAAPDFGPPRTDGATAFAQLPGFAREASDLRALLSGATILTGPEATESSLKAVPGPWILHLATHGSVQGPRCADAPTVIPGDPQLWAQIHAGIALAGVNACQSPIQARPFSVTQEIVPLPARGSDREANGEQAGLRNVPEVQADASPDDGWLSALEVAALDLYGTRLVVLSACDTGVGDSDRSTGIYGLRRALVLAGAETHMVSLWSVSDGATRYLMEAYYRKLREGAGRSEALRQVQLEMLKDSLRRHPFFWASFIVSGNPAPLYDEPEHPGGHVRPRGGCACDSASPGSGPGAVVSWLLILLSGRGWRRRSGS